MATYDLLTIDYETYWSQTHSLFKLTPIEYIKGSEFEVISCAMKLNDGPTVVHFGVDAIREYFDQVEWERTVLLAHNGAEFDHLISSWVFDIDPLHWADTLQMARASHLDVVAGGSLKLLAEYFELGEKGSLESAALVETKGKHLVHFTRPEREAMQVYNKQDVELCYALFNRLLPKVPPSELRLMDITTRMATRPQFDIDLDLLKSALHQEQETKQGRTRILAEHLNYPSEEAMKKAVRSAAQFKGVLEALGVPCPMKYSEKQDKMIPAVAKTDAALTELLEHNDPLVRMAVETRLDINSSIIETRLQRFIDAGRLCDRKIPTMLRYYGAKVTGRWSGKVAKLNQQNLPRVSPGNPKPSDALRMSMKAPPGYKVVVVDLSGIELRVNHFLWAVEKSMDAYKQDRKADLYVQFASESLYRVPPEQVTKDMRRNAKVAQLQLGFQSGADKFRETARQQGIIFTKDEAAWIVSLWRDSYKEIVRGWYACQSLLPHIRDGKGERPVDPWGHCHAVRGGIRTPKGFIVYPGLDYTQDERGQAEWSYQADRNKKSKLYGGKIGQNLVQHLARHVFTDVILAFARTPLGRRYQLAHTVHDEVVYVVRDKDAQAVYDQLMELMLTPPTWWPELVTFAEGDIGETYGDAK